MWPILFDFLHCTTKVSFITTVIILILTISPLIQFLLQISFRHEIILTWEVHRVVCQFRLIICFDITTTGCLRMDRFVSVTTTYADFFSSWSTPVVYVDNKKQWSPMEYFFVGLFFLWFTLCIEIYLPNHVFLFSKNPCVNLVREYFGYYIFVHLKVNTF